MNVNLFVDKLFDKAKNSGFEDFEIYYSGGRSFRVKIFEGKVDEYSVNKTYGISFRGLNGGKMGYAYTEAFDDEAIDMLIRHALQNAAIIENEDKQFIFAGSQSYSEVDAYNEALDNVTAKDKIEAALRLEQLAKNSHPAITSVATTIMQSGSGKIKIKNSKGLDLAFGDNFLFCYTVPIAQKGEKKVDGGEFQMVRDFSELDLEKIANAAAEKAVNMLDAAPAPSGEYRILLENECAGDLLDTFADIFSAENTQKDLSLLKGKVGKVIASEAVTIIDDPLMDGGYASSPFDSEGVATYTKNVVENGVLKTLLHNLKTAEKEGVKSTGNASKGSYKGSIGVSGFNFYLKPGEKTFNELCAYVKDGLIITELAGLHSGANGVSGDFSLSAKGFKIEGGKKGGAVEQITIAGNFFELLKDIELVGSDLKFGIPGAECIGSPSFVVKSLSVAG